MIDYKEATKHLLAEVRSIVLLHDVSTHHPDTVDREVVKLLQIAWAESVRAEWQAFVDVDPELKAQHAVAKELMIEDGYTMGQEPICGLPGVKPMVAIVDGKEAVCIDYSMAQVTPLSAIYVNKVRIVQSAAARVSKDLAEEAVKQPPEWPIKISSGETFNSVEEMEQSPIDAVKDMARMMKDAGIFACHPDAAPMPGLVQPRTITAGLLTCWQYFGFDGPTHFENLVPIYQEAMKDAGGAEAAGEVHRQYQNCLKELGAAICVAIMNGDSKDE